MVFGRVLQEEGGGDGGVECSAAYRARRGQPGGKRGGDGEVGGGGAVLAPGECHDGLEEEPDKEHLGAEGLPLRGAGGDRGQHLAHHGVGTEGSVRGGGGGKGAQELLLYGLGCGVRCRVIGEEWVFVRIYMCACTWAMT